MSIEAGRETDLRIAREVFGCTEDWQPEGWPVGVDDDGAEYARLPAFSTVRAAALEVVDRLIGVGLRVVMDGGRREWAVDVIAAFHRIAEADAPTLPLAICRAALSESVLAHLKRAEQHPEAE